MKEIVGDIWIAAEKAGAHVVVPTNGYVRTDGCAVMGRGLAFQAKNRYPELPRKLGTDIVFFGNHVYHYLQEKVITFPVKTYFTDKADLALIERSCNELRTLMTPVPFRVMMPRVGCGNGHLSWEQVKPILEAVLGDLDNVIVCDKV